MAERIQKLLAAAGFGSRRGIEEWLAAGRIRVNGRVAGLGDRAEPGDRIELDGRPLEWVDVPDRKQSSAPAVLLYHKPVGEVTTRRDPQGRPTVFDHLPPPPSGRWVVVGRLDVNTSGLLLFTNDGALAHRLMHPSFGVERRYLVRVRGTPDPGLPARLLQGVRLEDGLARFERIEPAGRSAGHAWYQVSLREGRNREVRRIFEAAGHEVSRLKRLSYGPVELPADLPAGRARLLPPAEALKLARFLR
ncbi:MAG: pseudouridine synthase [Pseudomonadota bacterium]|jgi:23S rRNA pseudouridine2605 synthase|nr:MAG: 23S rRNA pseudouridylate synthase B [Pseudomonadota bacterium]